MAEAVASDVVIAYLDHQFCAKRLPFGRPWRCPTCSSSPPALAAGPAQQHQADRGHREQHEHQLGLVRLVGHDHVHAVDRRDRGDRQGDRGDDGQPLHGDGHLGVHPGLVELDHAEEELGLAVGERAHPVELVGEVGA